MASDRIIAYGNARRFREETLARWLQLSDADQEALFDLTQALQLGENHFRDFLEWLEEISLRDGVSLGELLRGERFSRVLTDPRLSRNDKLNGLKEEVRRLRFPRLSQIENDIRKKIGELKLAPRIQVNVPPALEGGALTIQMRATSYEQLKQLLAELERALERDAAREVFALLAGRVEDARL